VVVSGACRGLFEKAGIKNHRGCDGSHDEESCSAYATELLVSGCQRALENCEKKAFPWFQKRVPRPAGKFSSPGQDPRNCGV